MTDAAQNDRSLPIMRVGLYTRVSTEEQREGKNIQSQIGSLRAYCTQHGNWKIVAEYPDDGWSGGLLARPALDRLRDDAAKGLLDIVLVNDVDRLARDQVNLIILTRDLQQRGVRVIFQNAAGLSDDPGGRAMLGMLGVFAEYEKAMITDRTRRGRKFKAQIRQQIVTSKPPYGYRYVPKDGDKGTEGHLEILPDEVRVVRLIFRWVVEDKMTIRGVVRKLTEEGIPTKQGKKKWGKSSVIRILRNETYCGTWHYNKNEGIELKRDRPAGVYRKRLKTGLRLRPRTEWIPVQLPKELHLIDKVTFEATQRQLARNAQFSSRNNKKNSYLLRSIVRCGDCGAPYVGTKRSDDREAAYRCNDRQRQFPYPKQCKARQIKREVLDEIVWSAITVYARNPELILKQAGIVEKKIRARHVKPNAEIEDIETDLRRVQAEEDRIMEAYRENVITLPRLRQELERTGQKKLVMERQLQELKEKDTTASLPPQFLKRTLKAWGKEIERRLQTMTFEEKQRAVRTIIEKIAIHTKDGEIRITGVVPLPGAEVAKLRGDWVPSTLLHGPPGAGKSLLAKALLGILPELSAEEARDVAKIWSVRGLLPAGVTLSFVRPFRTPHHSVSAVALIGGGTHPQPGEVSLAHRGVLFLDEFAEFPRYVLEHLRQPIEEGCVHVSRATGTVTFPARFTLVAAMNPCPCGYAGDPLRTCTCTPGAVLRYRERISGPLLDRIDLHVHVPPVAPKALLEEHASGELSAAVRARVIEVRKRQALRFGTPLKTNATLTIPELKVHCALSPGSLSLLERAATRLALSARGIHRVLRLARTIADLSGEERLGTAHLAEALQYRTPFSDL